jgi:SAM-dependent methyltransferase
LDYPATGADLYRAKPEIFADGAQLPLVDGCIDTVTILEVAEHLSDYRKALVEISRVLRPQGRMLLTMPFLYPIHDAPHDYQRLTIYGLARDVEHAGLRIDSLSTTLGSAQTAGLLSCLALAGMSVGAIKERSFGMIWVPPLLLAIPVINVTAWLVARLLPSWNAITAGYRLSATKL